MIPKDVLLRIDRGLFRFIFFCCFCICVSILLFSPEIAFNNTSLAKDQTKPGIQLLEPGKPIERQLGGGESHLYQIHLDAGQFLHLIIEQKGIDVVVAAFDPDGQKITEVDSPTGSQGEESVTLLSEKTGSYRIEVCSFVREAPSANYEIKIEELRIATQQDRMRLAATKAYQEAEQLQAYGMADSLRKALSKLENALILW